MRTVLRGGLRGCRIVTPMPVGPRDQNPVPLTVTALELNEGRLTRVHGSGHGGMPWHLSLADVLAAMESRRYSLGIRSGRERVVLVRRGDLARGFEARDRSGRDLVLDLPVITRDAPLPASVPPLPTHQATPT